MRVRRILIDAPLRFEPLGIGPAKPATRSRLPPSPPCRR